MPARFMPSNSKTLSEERRLRKLAQGLIVTKKDTTKIESLYVKFRNICEEIRKVTHIPSFKGTYDEVLCLPDDLDKESMDKLQDLKFKWQTLDSAIKVEATKLGYRGDQWLRNCWK